MGTVVGQDKGVEKLEAEDGFQTLKLKLIFWNHRKC